MFLRAAAALLTIDGTDVLLAEARAAVARIVGALPDGEIAQRFQQAEPVRVVVRLAGA